MTTAERGKMLEGELRIQASATSAGVRKLDSDFSAQLVVAPLVLARVASLPFEVLQGASGTSAAHMRLLFETERELSAQSLRVSENLFAAIPLATERNVRRELLSLRRRVFQLDGRVTASELEALDVGLSGESLGEARQFIGRLQSLAQDRLRLNDMYTSDYESAISQVCKAATSPNFQKGLASSSDTLFQMTGQDGHPSRNLSAAKNAQRMRGLIRYLSRAAMKATPFGTFCQLLSVSFEEAELPLRVDGDLGQMPSVVRLNKSLFKELRNVLFRVSSVREHLMVSLNDTIESDGDWLHVFAVAEGREAFLRVRNSPALEFVVSVVRGRPRVTLAGVVDALVQSGEVEATREECISYIDSLVKFGLLRFISPVDDQTPDWDRPFDEFLRRVSNKSTEVTAARQLLASLATQLSVYSTASARGRNAMQTRGSRIAQGFLQNSATNHGFRKRLMFYEDCGARARIVVDRQSFDDALGALRSYVDASLPMSFSRLEACDARQIFESSNPGVARLPLLRFAEQYARARIERRELQSRSADLEQTPATLQQIHRSRSIMTAMLSDSWAAAPNAQEIELTPAMFLQATSLAPPLGLGPRSVSVFCNLIPARDGVGSRVVVNFGRYLTGHGKYLSRFLPVLTNELAHDALQRNTGTRHGRIVEIADDADFNPNLHPRITESVIRYPTGSHRGKADAIAVRDLEVGIDQDDSTRLALTIRTTGERVWPVDLGFLNPTVRPPLFRLLRALGPDTQFVLSLPWGLPGSSGPSDSIVVRPRYTYGKHVILSRRAWQVPASCFPRLASSESSVSHFSRVQSWRFKAGIPDHAYVRIYAIAKPKSSAATDSVEHLPVEESEAIDQEDLERSNANSIRVDRNKSDVRQARRVSADLQKPQYIDFTNPLHVDLFGRLPGGLENFMASIEEVLPETTDYPRFAGRQHCTEFVVQLDLES